MGLIRLAIESAVGSNEPNNGFNSPRVPFGSDNNRNQRRRDFERSTSSPRRRPRSSSLNHRYRNMNEFNSTGPSLEYERQAYSSYHSPPPRSEYSISESSNRVGSSSTERSDQTSKSEKARGQAQQLPMEPPPPYEQQQSNWNDSGTPWNTSRDTSYSSRPNHLYERTSSRNITFRPLVLPQITHGKGSPFLRAYSDELGYRGIQEQDFLRVLDSINAAIIPNPELQIFQKAASIASWFVPGAASIGLMAGQLGVGVAGALGHSTLVARSLSKANLELFVPNGLELCIGSTGDVDKEVGLLSGSMWQTQFVDFSPEARLAPYGDRIAQLSIVFPPSQTNGRNDAIAKFGQGMSDQENQRKLRKAQEKLAKGRSKDWDKLERTIQWLIVRLATPGATQRWQETLQQSNAALEQEQANPVPHR